MSWLAGWGRRKSKTVIGSIAQAVIGYQLGVFVVHKTTGADTDSGNNHSDQHVYVGTNVRDDFGDVRFTDSDGTALLTYYISELDSGVSAKFWVKVDIGQSVSKDIYVYYDNSDATSIGVAESSMFYVKGQSGSAYSYSVDLSHAYTRAPSIGVDTLYQLPAYHCKSVRIRVGSTVSGAVIVYTGSKSEPSRFHRKYASGTLNIVAPYTIFTDPALQVEGNASEIFSNLQTFDGDSVSPWYWTGSIGDRIFTYVGDPAICSNTLYSARFIRLRPLIQLAVRQYVDPDTTFGAFGDEEYSGSADLLCELIVRNIGAANLPAEFVVKQWHENLPAEFEVGQDARDLPAEFEVGQGSEDLHGVFEGQTTIDLLAEFVVRHEALEVLPAEFEVGQDSEDLHAAFEGQTTVDLSGEFIVQHETSVDLPGELSVRQESSVDLKAGFDSQTSVELLGEFIIRQETSVDLFGEFVARHSVILNLQGEFVIRHAGMAELLSEFTIRHEASVELYGEFEVRRKTSLDLPSEFIVRHETSVNLHAAFKSQTSIDLFGRFIIRQETSVDLPGELSVRHPASEDLLCEFSVSGIIDDSENLLAEFRTRHEATVDLLGEFTVRHEASIDLLGEFDIRQPGSVELLAEFIVRHSAILDLSAEYIVRHEAIRDLLSGVTVRHTAVVGLPAEFIVRHSASIDLVARFDGQTTVSLHAEFDIRQPYPFWTDRELLNGVVHLDEVVIGDAALEEIIGGVMNDVRTWLLANEIATYSQWRGIDGTPLAIRRATTYGTVASMYARRIFSPHDVAVRVAPMDFKVITTHESAMEYWEEKMDEALENYLTSIGKMRIWVSTEDEDPEFTMDDVEEFSIPE